MKDGEGKPSAEELKQIYAQNAYFASCNSIAGVRMLFRSAVPVANRK